ncbi:MAG: hypothetical protein HY716_04065 [Planctomycetes bacterium]|nr:hypothetical protein [Planctomycetota bacterium]
MGVLAENAANWRDSGRLTPRQRRAIPFLVASPTREAGCEAAGVSRSTLSEWLRQPAFAGALEAAEDAAFREALGRVQKATGKAAAALEALLESGTESVRLRAAVELLGVALRVRDVVVLEERLASLESRLGINRNGERSHAI